MVHVTFQRCHAKTHQSNQPQSKILSSRLRILDSKMGISESGYCGPKRMACMDSVVCPEENRVLQVAPRSINRGFFSRRCTTPGTPPQGPHDGAMMGLERACKQRNRKTGDKAELRRDSCALPCCLCFRCAIKGILSPQGSASILRLGEFTSEARVGFEMF